VNTRPLNELLWWCNLVLRLASWIVPQRRRLEWRREWEAEVWHWCRFLVDSGRLSVNTEQDLLRHCWGAFADALWHRFNRVAVVRFVNELLRTPRFCLLACLALLAGLLIGRPAAVFHEIVAPAPNVDSDHLLTVSLGEKSSWLQPEVLRDSAVRWPTQTQVIASDATYAWRPSVVRGPEGEESVVSARVTSGMFGLLGVRPILGRGLQESDSSQCEDCVVLSNMLWRNQFRGDEHVIGRSLLLNTNRVKVIGVLPQFRFPRHDIGVYSPFGRNPHPLLPMYEWPGVLLRVSGGGDLETAKRQLGVLVNRVDSVPASTNLRVLSLQDIENQSLESWAGFIILALLLLLALKGKQFARLRTTGPHARFHDCLHWYLFFATKTTLLLIAVLVASFELVQAVVSRTNGSTHPLASWAAIWHFLFGAILSVNWSVRDQLSRCRTCLRRLGVEVEIGNAARSLLELTGAELVCNEGHGTLHIPLMEESCVDWERWTYLDDSWHTLLRNHETGISVS
jgi:hypothetical protein